MKPIVLLSALLASTGLIQGAVLQIDLSPPGTSPATGLSPANEVPAVTNSMGSGGEILTGITFDTDTSMLNLAVGYGSIAGFNDLTGPVTVLHLHSPAPPTAATNVLVDLAPLHSPAGDPAKGGVIFGSLVLNSAATSNLLAGLVYLNIHTATNPAGEIRGQLIVVSNSAPVISDLPTLPPLECTSTNGAPVSLSVQVMDAENDALTVVWEIDGRPFQTNSLPEGSTLTNVTVTLDTTLHLGSHEITAKVTDDGGLSDITITTVTVEDTVPPTIESIVASPDVLWPPNHKLVPVRIYVRATDACGPVKAQVSDVDSNEPINGVGDGNTRPDWATHRRFRTVRVLNGQRVTPLVVFLRAERSGQGNGRLYTVTVSVSDMSDNTTEGEVTVFVPHDKGQGRPRPGDGDDDDDRDEGGQNGHGNSNKSNGKAKGHYK